MALHLHLVCGPYRFVVDAAQVLETWSEGEGSGRIACRAPVQDWQGASLPVIDLRDALGLDPYDDLARRIKLVTAKDGHPFGILAVDAVGGLVEAAANEFVALPPLLAHSKPMFDAVLSRPLDGWRLLRLSPDGALGGKPAW